jgi:hypothetical protein
VFEVVVRLVVEGHLKDQVKMEIIHLDVSLLIVVLVYLQLEPIFSQRNIDLLPNFELLVKFD